MLLLDAARRTGRMFVLVLVLVLWRARATCEGDDDGDDDRRRHVFCTCCIRGSVRRDWGNREDRDDVRGAPHGAERPPLGPRERLGGRGRLRRAHTGLLACLPLCRSVGSIVACEVTLQWYLPWGAGRRVPIFGGRQMYSVCRTPPQTIGIQTTALGEDASAEVSQLEVLEPNL